MKKVEKHVTEKYNANSSDPEVSRDHLYDFIFIHMFVY
jgi:hypothetical protein